MEISPIQSRTRTLTRSVTHSRRLSLCLPACSSVIALIFSGKRHRLLFFTPLQASRFVAWVLFRFFRRFGVEVDLLGSVGRESFFIFFFELFLIPVAREGRSTTFFFFCFLSFFFAVFPALCIAFSDCCKLNESKKKKKKKKNTQ